jgi:hypothetical protein
MIIRTLKRLGIIRKFCPEGHLLEPSWKYCPICMAPVCAWLVGINGELKNRIYNLHMGKNRVGTGIDCEVRILQDSISRQHILISSKEKHYSVIDLNSITGTFVNNIQVSHKDIIDGDIIKLGEAEFIFKCL